MSSARVKICGVTCVEDLETAVDAGVNAVGFVVGFPDSPRNLTVEAVADLVRFVPPFVDSVAVVPFENRELIKDVVEKCHPRTLQLQGGDLTGSLSLEAHGCRLVRAITYKVSLDIESLIRLAQNFDAVLVDSYSPYSAGGIGIVHDWNVTARIRKQIFPRPLILAGGLNPDNVEEAISTVKPFAVDVSSGVEIRPGRKDPEKVRAFVMKAKRVSFSNQ
jgi:phosphoribosylanthranilate isomerase